MLLSLITSQFVTAPKLMDIMEDIDGGLITSQFVTAPKHIAGIQENALGFNYQSVCHCSKTTLQRLNLS